MPVELIDLKIDYAFKLLFGREGQEPLLAAFLNAVLKPPAGKQITSLTYTNNELGKDDLEDKESSLDIRAATADGRQIDIEIQLKDEHNMAQQSLYYWAKIYSRQLSEGMAYRELHPTITINILNFDYLQETDEFHSAFQLYEAAKQFLLTDILALHFIELPKLRQKWRLQAITPQQDRLVRWLLLLDGSEDEEIHRQLEAIAMEDPLIDRAMKDWESISADPRLREIYFDRRKAVLDRLAAVREAELRAQDAEAKGMAKGMAKGRAEAICLYLDARFGRQSHALQTTVRMMDDLDRLNRIMNHIFTAGAVAEAESIIQES